MAEPRVWTLMGEHGAHTVLGEQLPAFHRIRVVEAAPIAAVIRRLLEERDANADCAVGIAERLHRKGSHAAYIRAMGEIVGDGDSEVERLLAVLEAA